MSHTNKEPPSFFIVPSEKRDYKSSVKLGNVVYDIKQPHLVLFRPEEGYPTALTVNEIASPKTLNNYVIGKGDSTQKKIGLFAKVLEFFGAGGELSHQSSKELSEKYTIKSITFELLDPTPSFLAGLKKQNTIRDHLENGSTPDAFLITGLVHATGVTFESIGANDRANEASLGVNVQGAPLGFMGRRSRKGKLQVDWEAPGPTVLAFKVQKLRLKDGEIEAEDETEDAYWEGEDEKPRDEIDLDAPLDEGDVAGLTKEAGEDELLAGDYHLFLPDE